MNFNFRTGAAKVCQSVKFLNNLYNVGVVSLITSYKTETV